MCRLHREQARSHNVRGCPQISRPTPINCGSEPARDGGVSADINAGCAGFIASKLAPTMFEGVLRFRVRHRSTVGASLLAMAECQSTSMLDVPASSRASSLPQVSVASTNTRHTTKQRWERACSRWRSVSQHQCWMCRPHREQARSHRVYRLPSCIRSRSKPQVDDRQAPFSGTRRISTRRLASRPASVSLLAIG